MSRLTKAIGKRIQEARKQHEWSQEKLAELAKLNPSYVGKVERGVFSVGIDNLKKICKALDLKMSELFKGY